MFRRYEKPFWIIVTLLVAWGLWGLARFFAG